MEAPESDQPDAKMTYVTIPYFLYEAMARLYYTRGLQHQDFGPAPVRPVASEEPRTEFTGKFEISDDEIPTEWIPLGVARKPDSASSNDQSA